MTRRILLVDSDDDNLEYLSTQLRQAGYQVVTANCGNMVMESVKQSPDIIIINILLPDINGLNLVRELKQTRLTRSIPVIVMSEKDTEANEIVSLEVGADDYIIKPIQIQKLLARIRRLFRQQDQMKEIFDGNRIIRLNGLEIHLSDYSIKYENTTLCFPKKEFEILILLSKHLGKVFTRKEISLAIWGINDHSVYRTIDVIIGRIRKKLDKNGKLIKTVPGIGYRLSSN